MLMIMLVVLMLQVKAAVADDDKAEKAWLKSLYVNFTSNQAFKKRTPTIALSFLRSIACELHKHPRKSMVALGVFESACL